MRGSRLRSFLRFRSSALPLLLLFLPGEALAQLGCVATMRPRDGVIEVVAKGFEAAPVWGVHPEAAEHPFASCTVRGPGPRAKWSCRLGEPGTLAERTAPATCMIHVRDPFRTGETCSTWIRYCSTGLRMSDASFAAGDPRVPGSGQFDVPDPSNPFGCSTINFAGVNVQVTNGLLATDSVNACGNLIVGYNEEDDEDERTGSHNLIVGRQHSYTSSGAIIGGFDNRVDDRGGAVLAGFGNRVTGQGGAICGGEQNIARGFASSVSGGFLNEAGAGDSSGAYGSILGGSRNRAAGFAAVVGGGEGGSATGEHAAVLGGWSGFADSVSSVVVGGFGNATAGDHAVAVGGSSNDVDAPRGVILGGTANRTGEAEAALAVIVGGRDNFAGGPESVVVGGGGNATVTLDGPGTRSVVVGGEANVARGGESVVVGGTENETQAQHSVVVAGDENAAQADGSVIVGGREGETGGILSVLLGGFDEATNFLYEVAP